MGVVMFNSDIWHVSSRAPSKASDSREKEVEPSTQYAGVEEICISLNLQEKHALSPPRNSHRDKDSYQASR